MEPGTVPRLPAVGWQGWRKVTVQFHYSCFVYCWHWTQFLPHFMYRYVPVLQKHHLDCLSWCQAGMHHWVWLFFTFQVMRPMWPMAMAQTQLLYIIWAPTTMRDSLHSELEESEVTWTCRKTDWSTCVTLILIPPQEQIMMWSKICHV